MFIKSWAQDYWKTYMKNVSLIFWHVADSAVTELFSSLPKGY